MNGTAVPGVRPAAVWYALPILLLLVSITMVIVDGVGTARDFQDRMQGIGADGVGDVTLEAGTDPAVWAEYRGATAESIDAPEVSIDVIGPGGEPVDVSIRASSSNSRQVWSSGGVAAIKVAQFHAREAGTYRVAVEGNRGPTGWSVGDLDVAASIWRIGRWLIGIPIAIAMLVVLVLLRMGSKKRVRRAEAIAVIAAQTSTLPTATPPTTGPFS